MEPVLSLDQLHVLPHSHVPSLVWLTPVFELNITLIAKAYFIVLNRVPRTSVEHLKKKKKASGTLQQIRFFYWYPLILWLNIFWKLKHSLLCQPLVEKQYVTFFYHCLKFNRTHYGNQFVCFRFCQALEVWQEYRRPRQRFTKRAKAKQFNGLRVKVVQLPL